MCGCSTGFAIPIERVRVVAEQLIAKAGPPDKPQKRARKSKAAVQEPMAESPAEVGG